MRIDYPGACYHVMNRGNQRQVVFRQAQDCELFLAKLAAFGVAEAQETLMSFGGDTPAGMTAYREFVEEGLMRGIENPAEVVAARAVIGSKSFLDRVRCAHLLRRHGDQREEPEL